MTTLISAYEPYKHRYSRLVEVMLAFNECVGERFVSGSRRKAKPSLISLHEHKGELQVTTDIPLTSQEQELMGYLWEFKGNEPRENIIYADTEGQHG